MYKKFLFLLGIGTIVLLYVFNVGHAVDNYGILYNNMSINIFAQDSITGGDENDESDEADEGGDENPAPPGYNEYCWKNLPNNHNGGNPFLFCNLKGSPVECVLSKWVKKQGKLIVELMWGESCPAGIGWE